MTPEVYLYRKKENRFQLYLGGFSTLEGLNSINERLNVRSVRIGASNYQQFGWATEKEFPNWKTVQEIKAFLAKEDELELIDFEIELIDFGYFSTHDDRECHYVFERKEDLIQVVKTVSNPVDSPFLVSELLHNPEMYISFKKSGKIRKYYSFNQYLDANKEEN